MMDEIIRLVQQTHLSLPAIELVILLTLLSLSLVFRYNRCGMMTAYIFAYRWGWLVAESFPEQAQVAYIVFGVLVGALFTIGILSDRKSGLE